MLQITVSGKPSNWMDAPEGGEQTRWVGCFDLVERRWNGTNVEIYRHTIYVPAHRAKRAKGQAEKGFTIVVVADRHFPGFREGEAGELPGFNLGAVDILDI